MRFAREASSGASREQDLLEAATSKTASMETKRKILLVDDDPEFLEIYRELLANLPSHPEVQTAVSGARAIAALEAEPFDLLITDLKMPRMDGLQLLSIIRRKLPDLRTVVLTSVVDEQFRARVYSLGVDIFWQKPNTEREVGMFRDCIQSLLEREEQAGFRGVHSKSLVDIIQLECLSQSSSVLRITNGPLIGKIWINQGELYDAEAGNLRANEAFQHILSWKTGTFEVLPAEPDHPQAITVSYNALLLESAQAIDEARGGEQPAGEGGAEKRAQDPLSQFADLEFFITLREGSSKPREARGFENPEGMAKWTKNTLDRLAALGDRLQIGQPESVVGLSSSRHVGLAQRGDMRFCIGWRHSLDANDVREMTKKAAALWVS